MNEGIIIPAPDKLSADRPCFIKTIECNEPGKQVDISKVLIGIKTNCLFRGLNNRVIPPEQIGVIREGVAELRR